MLLTGGQMRCLWARSVFLWSWKQLHSYCDHLIFSEEIGCCHREELVLNAFIHKLQELNLKTQLRCRVLLTFFWLSLLIYMSVCYCPSRPSPDCVKTSTRTSVEGPWDDPSALTTWLVCATLTPCCPSPNWTPPRPGLGQGVVTMAAVFNHHSDRAKRNSCSAARFHFSSRSQYCCTSAHFLNVSLLSRTELFCFSKCLSNRHSSSLCLGLSWPPPPQKKHGFPHMVTRS